MILLLVLIRALHIGSALLITSLLFFREVTLRQERGGREVITRPFRHWLIAVFLLQLLSGAGWLWLVAAGMNESSLFDALNLDLFQTVLRQTQFGQLWLWRLAFALVLGASLAWERRRSPAKEKQGWTSLAMASLLLLSLAWAGHAAADAGHHQAHLSIDLVHLAIAAIWPVGLVPLALFLRAVSMTHAPAEATIPLLHRFSRMSLLGVILLLLTGTANALFFFPSVASLFTTTYGRLLLGKVALFLLLVAIGAANRFSFLPALDGDPSAADWGRLRNAVIVESALCLIVILIVGAMGATSPPLPSS